MTPFSAIFVRSLPQTRNRVREPDGFALVISLSLMAVVLLAVILLAGQVRLGIAAANGSRSDVQARESAKLGLLVALGNLQKHAGPDQRVTARSDLFLETGGPNETLSENGFWTGVWDTSQEEDYENGTLEPFWLVSGDSPDPSINPAGDWLTLVPGYIPSDANGFDNAGAFHPVRVESLEIDVAESAPGGNFAWWVGDEGVRASVLPQDELLRELEGRAVDESYLDYGKYAVRILPQIHHPSFSFPLLYSFPDATHDDLTAIRKLLPASDMALSRDDLTDKERDRVRADAAHDLTVRNRFVLSNPVDGGLKKDLTYLKTLDWTSLTQAEITDLYGSEAARITPQAVRFLQIRSDPSSTGDVRGQDLVFPADTVEEARAMDSRFTFAPIITEFQLTCGVAAEGGNLANNTRVDSDLYLVYKIYFDIWNPYTSPMRIGDAAAAGVQNSWDFRIEVNNLPSARITNQSAAGSPSVNVDIPNLEILWSEQNGSIPGKTLRPGMNYYTTLPRDNGGSNDVGALHVPLGKQLYGARNDDYTGSFNFSSGPLEIVLYAIDSGGNEEELSRAIIDNYPDFQIDYIYNWTDRSSWFKRVPTSDAGWGMGNASLEVIGYAFGFRYRLLDEQESIGTIEDLSSLLSKTDVRNPIIEVDLSTWDINDAWDSDSGGILPYDFQTNATDSDPGFFDPSYGFLNSDFFYFQTAGSGRRDRIARVYEVPVTEIASITSLRNIEFNDFPANAMGNPWGGVLNRYYDAFFFSTLPDANEASWDGRAPLRNPKIKRHRGTPQLNNPNAAGMLVVENGFNVNSTSSTAWSSVLTGRSFGTDDFSFRYEQPNESKWFDDPIWEDLGKPLQNVLFNFPQTANFNIIERPADPRYEILTMDGQDDYPAAFSMDTLELNQARQHPAFIQGLREMEDAQMESLGVEVVEALRSFASSKNRPPFSMAEFLNAGILQEAVDAVASINDRDNGKDKIPRYAPANVNQGTLISKIGDFSFVRSDTFRIRAYGSGPDAGDSAPGLYCEAFVQRVPEEHAVGGPFGRRFEILSFRWIPQPEVQL